ncbi:MAG: tetratricopeptide repeat protein [bacterium]
MTRGQRRLSLALLLTVVVLTASLAAQDTRDPYPPLVRDVVEVRDSLKASYTTAVGMDRAVLAWQLGVWCRDPETAAVRPWNDRVSALFDMAMMKRGRYTLSQDDYPRRPEGQDYITSPHWTKALRDLDADFAAERFDKLGMSYWSHWPGLLDEIKALAEARLADRRHDLDSALVCYKEAYDLTDDDALRGVILLGAANELNRKQKHQAALDTLLWSVKHGGFSDDALFAMGRTLIYLGRIREAITMLGLTLDVNPYHEQAHYFLGNGYTSRNYTQIEEAHPEAFPATDDERNELEGAKLLMKSGLYPEAADSLMALRRLHASWIEPVTMLAEISWLKGEVDLSEAFCQEALKLIPAYGRAHAIFAKVQETRRLERSKRRVAFHDKLLADPTPNVPEIEKYVLNWNELTPRHKKVVTMSVYPWRRFVTVLQETGSTLYIKPIHELLSNAPYMTPLRDQRINLDSRLWDDVRGAGGFHTVTGIEDVERQLYGGYNTVVHEMTHQVHGLLTTPEKKRLQEAYQNTKAQAADGKDVFMSRYQASTVWEYFAEGVNAFVTPAIDEWDEREIVRERLGRDTALVSIVRDFLALEDMAPYYTEGHVNATYQDLEEGRAEHAWSRLQKIDPSFSSTRPVLAARSTVASLLGMDSIAVDAAQNYIKGYPDEPDGYALLSTALKHSSEITRDETAVGVLERGLTRKTLQPRYPLHLALAREQQLAGAFTSALANYDSALAVQADLPEALWGHAETLADSGMISRTAEPFIEADSMYRQAVQLRSGVVELRLDYARMLIAKGNYSDAEEQITEAESLIPGDPLAVGYRAWLIATEGDTAHARELLVPALANEPVPDETKVLASCFGVEGVPPMKTLLGEMAQETPRYVYNPRRFRYETRGELLPWYMVLLRRSLKVASVDSAETVKGTQD